MEKNPIEQVYLGTWFQRTSLHLQEIFDFLKDGKAEELETEKTKDLLARLRMKEVTFREGPKIDFIEVQTDDVTATITADGVVLMAAPVQELDATISTLEAFYSDRLSPVLSYLFSRGAPLPKELASVKTVYPHLLVGKGVAPELIDSIFKKYHEAPISTVSSEGLKIVSGNTIAILSLAEGGEASSKHLVEELLRNIIFFREFEQQLHSYLNLHRTIWSEISDIRDAGDFRYSDFPVIRKKVLEFLKTLAFVKARIAQMDDILAARRNLIDEPEKNLLTRLGINKFEQLAANRNYIAHLWEMTVEYADGSLNLLESLYQENTQRELNTLKFLTLIGALTGFFGMNIAFPWEERWGATYVSSAVVIAAIVIICVSFYYLLKYLIYNRHFTVKK